MKHPLLLVLFTALTTIPQLATADDPTYIDKKTEKVSGGDYASNGQITTPVSFCEYILRDDAAVEGQKSVMVQSDENAHVGGTFFVPKAHYPLVDGDHYVENGATVSYSNETLTSVFISKDDGLSKEVETLKIEVSPDMKTVGSASFSFKKKSLMGSTLISAMTCDFAVSEIRTNDLKM